MNTMNNAAQTLKGFRDILPEEKRKRDWVSKKIVEVFELFGFQPLETPTLEYASLLLGKYGVEADKLVYTFEDKGQRKIGLRYDQTVPTARVLGQYQNQLSKYFRRYQIQNVFRADKPQKGRYREFTQCDIDIFGTQSELADAEILACTYQAYKNIGFEKIQIHYNFRPLLVEDFSKYTSDRVSIFSILQSLDKLDKETPEQVMAELEAKGLNSDQAKDCVTTIRVQVPEPEELAQIRQQAVALGINSDELVFNRNLIRGLDYYTGMIFEVKIDNFDGGSVGGGGRYDNLIQDLTGLQMPAVGMAFGFDRTVEAADQLNLIPNQKASSQVLITYFDESTREKSLELATIFRKNGIKTEIYPEVSKLAKQYKLANQKNIPYVVTIGFEELENSLYSLKNLQTGIQESLTLEDTIHRLQS